MLTLWKLKHWAIYCDLTKQLHRTYNTRINRDISHIIFVKLFFRSFGRLVSRNTSHRLIHLFFQQLKWIFLVNTKSNVFKYNLNHNSFDLAPSLPLIFVWSSSFYLCFSCFLVVPKNVNIRYPNILRRWQKSFIIRNPTII